MSDTMISAVVAGEDIYGVAAVTTSVVEHAQRVHGACPTAAAALGRLLTGGALMGCLCKEPEHRIALQITCKGPIQKIHVEVDGAGHVRGYPGQSVVNLPSRHGKLDVGGAVGKGGTPCHEGYRLWVSPIVGLCLSCQAKLLRIWLTILSNQNRFPVPSPLACL